MPTGRQRFEPHWPSGVQLGAPDCQSSCRRMATPQVPSYRFEVLCVCVRQVNSATPGVTGDLFQGEKECVSVRFWGPTGPKNRTGNRRIRGSERPKVTRSPKQNEGGDVPHLPGWPRTIKSCLVRWHRWPQTIYMYMVLWHRWPGISRGPQVHPRSPGTCLWDADHTWGPRVYLGKGYRGPRICHGTPVYPGAPGKAWEFRFDRVLIEFEWGLNKF